MCVCIRACGVPCLYVCLYVFMYSCVRIFIYVYYVYHYKYECMRVDKCVRCIQRFETNCLRVRRFFFFFLVHFFFSCVFSRVIASRLEKLNIPCIHIYACLYICVCIQLKGTRCWFLSFFFFFFCAPKVHTPFLSSFLPSFFSLSCWNARARRRRVSYANIISDIIVCMYNRLGYVLRIKYRHDESVRDRRNVAKSKSPRDFKKGGLF